MAAMFAVSTVLIFSGKTLNWPPNMPRESIFVHPFFPGNQSGSEIISSPSNDTSSCLSQQESVCVDSQSIFRDLSREHGKAFEENDSREIFITDIYIHTNREIYLLYREIIFIRDQSCLWRTAIQYHG